MCRVHKIPRLQEDGIGVRELKDRCEVSSAHSAGQSVRHVKGIANGHQESRRRPSWWSVSY